MNKYVIIDLETTGHTPSKGDRIIEVGIIVWSNGEIIEEYSTLVNPEVNISTFITNLTGITDEDVSGQPIFEDIAEQIRILFDDAYFVAHNVPFDLGFLNDEFKRVGLAPLIQPVIDTVELSRILLPQAPGFKLGQLATFLELSHVDPHRALSDAHVTSYLLAHLLNKIYALPYETIVQLRQMEPRIKSDLGEVLKERENQLAFLTEEPEGIEIFRGLALKKHVTKAKSTNNTTISFGEIMERFYQKDGDLAKAMSQFEMRSGQREMTELIYDAFQSKQHAIIEAETGTGKSLAYLIVALFQAVHDNERVVVSTHLTQLQTQLIEKEIPLLEKVLSFPFQTAILKGKQHYLSLAKFEQTLRSSEFDNYDITLTKAIILIWLTETTTGDIDEIQLPSSGQQFFRKVSTEAEGGLDVSSPWFTRSFYYRAKTNAQKSDVIITNHALLCANMTSEIPLLPSFQKIIIDEAHHLEATASKHFGLSLDYVSVQRTLQAIGSMEDGAWIQKLMKYDNDIALICKEYEWDKWWLEAKEETDTLFRFLFQYVKEKQVNDIAINDIGRYQYRIPEGTDQGWDTIIEMVNRLSFQLRDLIHILSRILHLMRESDMAVDLMEEVKWHMKRIQTIIDELENYFIHQLKMEEVKWIEIDAFGAQNAVYLYQEPIDVADLLQEKLFQEKQSVIMTSATLTMKNSFSVFKERVGLLKEDVLEKKIISPYAYEDQVQLLIPTDFPYAKYGKMDDFIEATCEAILSLAHITKGRMLVLFTSYDMLKKAYILLREIIDEEEYMLIAQGVSSGSRSRLKKNFQTFDQAILLGTNSFWEGIDIPGSDLSCVVIVRLPFQPPNHPVYQAKANYLKKSGKNPFATLALPNAIIRFKQGFGRLIRSSTDRGIVFVCDDRIMTAKYSNYFIDSIPEIPIHHKTTKELMEIAQDWL
ncbi:ATP-dependent DNA helicase DinG [Paraliobacillus zengyii]|uniref:ATP-dependent DNA helicase DinG n=1 Tax=Paraliobacillus zengyii TaxID=2213194 RepID=UPI000DD45B7C|nr:ATP-dependent DNA helicase DinG [Paraliobacillus zengyii]